MKINNIKQSNNFYPTTVTYIQSVTHKLEQLELLHCEISPATPWLPILVINIRSQVKTRQSQSYKFEKIAQNSNFGILQTNSKKTHLLKLLDKMYKYQMDPTRAVGTTEQTRNAGRTDGRKEWNQYSPPSTSLCRWYNKLPWWCHYKEMLSVLLAFCERITGGFSTKRASCVGLWCFLWC